MYVTNKQLSEFMYSSIGCRISHDSSNRIQWQSIFCTLIKTYITQYDYIADIQKIKHIIINIIIFSSRLLCSRLTLSSSECVNQANVIVRIYCSEISTFLTKCEKKIKNEALTREATSVLKNRHWYHVCRKVFF